MSDLDRAMRAMLLERAQDIAVVPPDLVRLDSSTPRSHVHRTAWLVAATVVAVLAVVGVTLAVTGNHGSRHGTPPATHVPSPTPTTRVTGTHLERRAALSWFGMAPLTGFAQHLWQSEPGYRSLAVRRAGDTATPIGCNGCVSASDYIYVYDKGAFDAAARHVSTWQHVTVGTTPAFLGTTSRTGNAKYNVTSVAWQFRPGEWALVQGVTPAGSTQQALLAVADAVRPATSVPIGLPMTFDYLPDLPVVEVTDDRSEGYAFTLTLGNLAGRSFSLTLWNGTSLTYYNSSTPVPHSVGGLAGYYDTQNGAGVLYHGGGAAIGLGDPNGPVTPADDREMQRVLAGLHWANGDGRAPLVPAERAIP
jgi:hypothetical protein